MGLFDGFQGLPQHFFKTMCQDPQCKEPLGGLHIPCMAGMAVYICPRCKGVNLFKQGAEGISGTFLGHPAQTRGVPAPRR